MKIIPIIIVGMVAGMLFSGRMPRIYQKAATQVNTEAVARPLTATEIIGKAKHPEDIMVIWKLESNMGKETNPQSLNNYCKAQGKSNEYGYGGMQNKWCYDTFEQATQVVDEWLEKERYSALCRYNTGARTQTCWYAETAKTLLER